MSNCVLFTIPGNEVLANSLIKRLHTEPGEAIIRHFPDGETYVKVNSNVFEKEAIIICSLHQPDDKILPLYFLAKTLKEFRASPVTLVSPYLAYMRRDKRFTDGECISSELFARLLSSFVDKLITIAPHLHRRFPQMTDSFYHSKPGRNNIVNQHRSVFFIFFNLWHRHFYISVTFANLLQYDVRGIGICSHFTYPLFTLTIGAY